MRILFLGKGGSGKTTISAATTLALHSKFMRTLAIDADLNAHLGRSMGFDKKIPKAISENFTTLAKYFLGSRNVKHFPPIGTIPPTKDSCFVRIDKNDTFMQEYGVELLDNLFYISTGTYTTEDLGDSCFHAKLNGLEMMLHHLLDSPDELVVIDSAAGIDAMATSLYFVADVYFFVIEPTIKSVSVYKDYLSVLQKKIDSMGITIIPIFNKIEGEDDIHFLQKQLGNNVVSIQFPIANQLSAFEKGDNNAIKAFVENHQEQMNEIYQEITKKKRDYTRYFEHVVSTFRSECDAWANETFSTDFSTLIDPTFTYKAHV